MQLFDSSEIDVKKLPHSFSKFRFGVASKLSVPAPLPSPASLPPALDGVDYAFAKETATIVEDKRSALCGLKSGERGALDRLERYLGGPANVYHKTRNQMLGASFSTKFSVFFSLGALSPRLAWHRTARLVQQSKDARACPKTALELEFLSLAAKEFESSFVLWMGQSERSKTASCRRQRRSVEKVAEWRNRVSVCRCEHES